MRKFSLLVSRRGNAFTRITSAWKPVPESEDQQCKAQISPWSGSGLQYLLWHLPRNQRAVLISVLMNASLHSLAVPAGHTHTAEAACVSTRNCWLLHWKGTCDSFPFHFRGGQRNVFRNMLVYWGCQFHLSKYICRFKIKEKWGKTIHKKHWSSLSSDKCLTSALTEENLFSKTYRMCKNFGLQEQLRPMFLLCSFHIMLET